VFTGYFDGYTHLIGDDIVHKRTVTADRKKKTIKVEDKITGTGKHVIESFIHLHPEVRETLRGSEVELQYPQGKVTITSEQFPPDVRESWYCPEFYKKERRKVLVLGGEMSLPVTLNYTIHYGN
jgi:hypothetical protein